MITTRKLSTLIGASVVASLAAVNTASADTTLFGYTDLASGYNLAFIDAEEKGQEGSCGENKAKEGKCGEAKAGEKAKEGKCGEGKCGEQMKGKDGKCGEGKCGEMKAKDGKCGEGKCGEKKDEKKEEKK